MSDGPYMVRLALLKTPLAIYHQKDFPPDGVLLHAIPRTDYTRFDTLEAAQAAVDRSAEWGKSLGFSNATLEILRVEDHEEETLRRSERRERKRAKRYDEPEPESAS